MGVVTNYSSSEAVITKLLRALKININRSTIILEMEKHPDHPSLLSLSDILTSLNIENAAYRIEFDEIKKISCPFIAHTNLTDEGFVLINEIKEHGISISNERLNKHKMKLDEFSKIFSGVVLAIDVSENDSERAKLLDLKNIFNKIKFPVFVLISLFIFISFLFLHTTYFTIINWNLELLTFVKSVGIIISIFLLIQSIDKDNPLIRKLCPTEGSTDCNAILSSSASKVFDGLSWSEVGFYYFLGTWLILIFGSESQTLCKAIAILNILSLPYTFYSIYYQFRIARKWCKLCCIIQGLLWMEFVLFLGAFKSPILLPNFKDCVDLFAGMLIPIILWLPLKRLLLKTRQVEPLKKELQLFKFNTNIFNLILTDQHYYTEPHADWCLEIGNPSAKKVITIATNPNCKPCAETHKILDNWLKNRNDLKLKIVFAVSNNDDEVKTEVSRHLMALNHLEDKEFLLNAMNEWFSTTEKDFSKWKNKYSVLYNNDIIKSKIESQKQWCKMAGINVTPTLLLNGFKMPEFYQLEDLKYII